MLVMRDDGWCDGVQQMPSPNIDQRPVDSVIDLLVIHYISLPAGEFGGSEISDLFCNQLDIKSHPSFADLAGLRVSSHFLIQRIGVIIQYASCNARAWHAGFSQFQERSRCNDFSIGIELEGSDAVPFTAQQYQQLSALTHALCAHYPLRAVRGHQHIAPLRKSDPGPFFDWLQYQQASPLHLDFPQFMKTPYELGNQNQTTYWQECISFYEALAKQYPQVLQFAPIGISDGGYPIHAGVVSGDGIFDLAQIQQAKRPIFFNNNGIHPGEPEGIDACMALVRDFCEHPTLLQKLGPTIYLFIAIYNVDGANCRNNSSRVNQDGPESFGFRGNSLHLDLNRDFLKCDSRAAQCFNQFFSRWQPDVMVDTHTSNGADYPYTMTLIPTQPDKLGGELGQFLRAEMLPAIYSEMANRGWETCPYVNPIETTPEQGLVDFLETPRFSTGYAALHHCIGFMPETHMLKPYADRYASMRALIETVLDFTIKHAAQIQALRQKAKQARPTSWPVAWQLAAEQPTIFRFKGYRAIYQASLLGNYQRLAYDKSQPWQADIALHTHFVPAHEVRAPQAYVIGQQWQAVIARLELNGVQMRRIPADKTVQAEVYRVSRTTARSGPYEGHMFFDEVELSSSIEEVVLKAGDFWLDLNQANARYAVESLEPMAHDSFFRWGMFNSVLERKETYSDYIFEDHAQELLATEPALREKFEAWKQANPSLLNEQTAVLDYIFTHCERYREPQCQRYPVWRIV